VKFLQGPKGGADHRPDTSLHYETTVLVHREVCLFTLQPSWYSVGLPVKRQPC